MYILYIHIYKHTSCFWPYIYLSHTWLYDHIWQLQYINTVYHCIYLGCQMFSYNYICLIYQHPYICMYVCLCVNVTCTMVCWHRTCVWPRASGCLDMIAVDGQFTFTTERPQLSCAAFLSAEPTEVISVHLEDVDIDCRGGDFITVKKPTECPFSTMVK